MKLARDIMSLSTFKQDVRFFVESCGSPGSAVYAALVSCTNPFFKA